MFTDFGLQKLWKHILMYYRTTQSQHVHLWMKTTAEERYTLGGKERHNCKVTKQIISYVHRG